jgi:outer membrane receptor protein involved in Fe transport
MAKLLFGPGVLLLSGALSAQAVIAQTAAPEVEASNPATADTGVDVVAPGGEIVILGRRDGNIQRGATQVLSILSAEDLARTGEGDIAGALSRVTGLSIANNGFVYVRGLGDRYSQALLNGSPLPSPEPLRRAVPLDLFPSDVIASSLVQKTYSPNYTGEFGGGLINLTTLAVPKESFFNVNYGMSGDTFTTSNLGYTYYGSKSDWTGYDNGARNTPSKLDGFLAVGDRMSSGKVNTGEIAKQFVTVDNGLVQMDKGIAPNFSGGFTGGTSKLIGDTEVGLIATAGYSNKWRTKDNSEQTPASLDLSAVDKDYRTVSTENRIVLNGLFGLGFEWGDGSKLRWTNLYIRDTLKRASLSEGKQNNQRLGADFREQQTGWYERQMFTSQLNAQFKIDPVKVDVRAAYAKSSRNAPYELGLGYSRSNNLASPYGQYFINRLDNGQTGFARISFSDLNETLGSAGLDATYTITPQVVAGVGYEFTNTKRESQRREFQIIAPSTFPNGAAMFRPDYLLGAAVIEYYGINLIESTESNPAFDASLRTNAGYLQLQAELVENFEINAGARLEKAQQNVSAMQVFNTANTSNPSTALENSYVLPAVTLTYKFHQNMQVRVNGSKSIARPQFRELMFQAYYDPESNRAYRGNPLLVDSQFTNAEARFEWYFDRDQRFSAASFYKQIDKPIEAFTGFNDNTPVTSYANAPKATLMGLEVEVQKYYDLSDKLSSAFFGSRRAVVIGNYTYTKSRISVGAGDTTSVYGTAVQPASNFFADGTALTGQSDHLVNLQLGLEDNGKLSQQTLLFSYVSPRVTSRGAAGLPDIYEDPGLTVDFVARQGFTVWKRDLEFKFEARNLLNRGYKEYQERGGNVVYYNRYKVGTSFSASVTAKF